MLPAPAPWTIYLAVVAVALMCGLAAPPHPLTAQPAPATVSLGQSPASPAAGDEATVTISISGGSELNGLDIELAYDPAALEIIDADPETEGTQVTLGPYLAPDFVLTHTVDADTGRIRAIFTQLAPSEAANGDGVLLTLRVRALVDAPAPPTILGVILARTDGIAQPAEVAGEPAVAPSSPATITAPIPTLTPTPPPAPESTATTGQPTATTEAPATPEPSPPAAASFSTQPPASSTSDSESGMDDDRDRGWVAPAVISVFVVAIVGGVVLRWRRR